MAALGVHTPVTYAHPEAAEANADTDKKGASADPTKDKEAPDAKPAEPARKDTPKPKIARHEFSGTFNGTNLTYVATAGETYLKNEKATEEAFRGGWFLSWSLVNED